LALKVFMNARSKTKALPEKPKILSRNRPEHKSLIQIQ